MIKLLLTSRASTFIEAAVAAFDGSPNCTGVTILNNNGNHACIFYHLHVEASCTMLPRLEIFFCAGTRLTVDELDQIDDSQFEEPQLILPTDPRPTSDNVNTQLIKIVRILGVIGQRVGVSAAEMEAQLADEPEA